MRVISIVFLAVSLLLLAYVIGCAVIVPLTIDEAWTYKEFVMETPVWKVVTLAHPVANNHILNSLLVKICASFSSSELSLRLPNILAFLLYLYTAYKLCSLFFNTALLQSAFFLALACNTNLVHVFALTRGYGLSIAFMLYAVYQLLLFAKYLPVIKNKHLHLSLLSSAIAVYASFTLLYFCGAMMLAATIAVYLSKPDRGLLRLLKAAVVPFLYFILLAVLCANPVYKLATFGELYYGGIENFVTDTLTSLLQDVLGIEIMSKYQTAAVITGILLLLFPLLTPLYYLISKKNKTGYLYIAPFILLFVLLCINVSFYFFGAKLVIHRTALYLYPVIILAVFSTMALIQPRFAVFTKTVTVALSGLLVVFFIAEANFSAPSDWWFDNHNKEVLRYIIKNPLVKNKGGKTRLYAYPLCVNSFNYYITTRYAALIEPVQTGEALNADHHYDYYYLNQPLTDPRGLKPVLHYDDGFTLYRRD